MVKSKEPLEVCLKCGWYDSYGHKDHCKPLSGKTAKQLCAAIPDVPSTQLGYGEGNVAFAPDENFHIRFRVHRSKAIGLGAVWLFSDLTQADAVDLVQTLVAWRKRCGASK